MKWKTNTTKRLSKLQEHRDNHSEFDRGGGIGFTTNDPHELFNRWYEEVSEMNEDEPNAFSLTTIDSNGRPTSRIVYLKDIIDGKFVFYSNYNSDKGKAIESNPNVHVLFFWRSASRQVSIHGTCNHTSREVSEAYFNSRPRGSKIGAWASNQSDVLENRMDLEASVKKFEEQFPDEVPCPPHWGGFEIEIDRFEFWQGMPSRLHDRLIFKKEGDSWKQHRKQP